MRHASLFSGIGAPELAAYWLGWENVFHCEINPFCRQVLNYWFTNSKSYEDITKTDFREWQGTIDVLTGGFPCQPFSVAGKRKGAEDDRFIITKNGMLRKVNQNGSNGSVGLGRIFHLMNTPTASDWKGGSTREKAYGNAMVPQVIYQIYKIIDEIEQ